MGCLIVGIILTGAIALSVACGPSEAEIAAKAENQQIIDEYTAWINLLTDASLTVSVGCLAGEGAEAFDEIDRRSLKVDGVTRYPYDAAFAMTERFYDEHPEGGVYTRDLCAVYPMYAASEIEKAEAEIARRQTLP